MFDTIGNNFLLFMLMIVCNRMLFGNELSPKLVMVIVIYYKFRKMFRKIDTKFECIMSFDFIPV